MRTDAGKLGRPDAEGVVVRTSPPDAQRLSKRWLGGRGRLGLPLGPAPGAMAFYIPGNRPGALKYGGAPSDSWGASGLPVKAEFKNGAVAS